MNDSITPVERLSILLSGEIYIGDTPVRIHRNVDFNRDIDDSWTINVELPEHADENGRYPDWTSGANAIFTESHAVEVIMHFMAMLANPADYSGKKSVRIGPDMGPKPVTPTMPISSEAA